MKDRNRELESYAALKLSPDISCSAAGGLFSARLETLRTFLDSAKYAVSVYFRVLKTLTRFLGSIDVGFKTSKFGTYPALIHSNNMGCLSHPWDSRNFTSRERGHPLSLYKSSQLVPAESLEHLMNDQITSVSKRLVKSFSRREKELKALIADYRPPSVLPSFRGLKSDVIVSGVVDTKTIDTEDGQFVVQYRGDGFIFVGSWGFSPGFRSVTRNGKHFCNNTRSQGKIFGRVFQYHEDGFKSASQAELREFLADSRSDETDDSADFGSSRPGPKRLRDIFRGHPLWRTLLATTDGPDSKASFNFNWAP